MSQPQVSRHGLTFIFITCLLDAVGFGIVIPVTPELIMELAGEGLSQAALYAGWLMFLYALMQFICAPVMGNLSDRFGRRPVLLLSLLAFGLDYVLMGFAPTLFWLFLGRFLAGITGATFSTANAYVADVSPPEKRAANFGLLGAAFGLGLILGPVLGGLLGDFGARMPFFAAAGLTLLNVVYGFFVLPETLPVDKRRRFEFKRANPLGALMQMRRFPVVIGLFAALLLYQIAHDANPATWTYYTMFKFGWTELEVGYSLGAVGLALALVQGFVIRSVIPRIGERKAVYLGYSLMAVGYLGYALAPSGWVMYVFIVPFALGGLGGPALRGIMSNQVPPDQQGELQGSITSVQSFTAIFAPLVMTQLFGYFTADPAGYYFPGAPFFLASVLMIGALAVGRRRSPEGALRASPFSRASIPRRCPRT